MRLTPLACCVVAGCAALVAAHVDPAVSHAEVPSVSDQQHLLDLAGDYAERYVSNLPDFLCDQVVRQFESGRKDHWKEHETLTSRLTFVNGREHRTLRLVNGKNVEPGSNHWRTPPLVTEGEFGLLIGSVFSANSDANFHFNRWDTLNGKRLAVFDYSIDRQHSGLSLTLSDLARAFIPYHGSFFVDSAGGTIWRISSEAEEIPEELRTIQIVTTIDYGEVPVGPKQYILPVAAEVLMTNADHRRVRHLMTFENYRKFEADSTITFGGQRPAQR
ncbi:MAG TPA: hypothetical protein VHZ07_00830 [Bryobacteraceae bacterium]|nr:hypothetical protein [Bryobacteraceae bacterium]